MLTNRTRIARLLRSAVAAILLATCSSGLLAQDKRPFTATDAISTTLLHDGDIHFSPDGKYVAISSDRKRLDINRVESSLQLYRTSDIERFVLQKATQQPSPIWEFKRSAKEDGGIRGAKWLRDSSGIAFLQPAEDGNQRLMLADVRTKTVTALTPQTQSVRLFDIRDRSHYVYTIGDLRDLQARIAQQRQPLIVGTGRELSDLIFWNYPGIQQRIMTRSRLWAADGGRAFEVGDDVRFPRVGGVNSKLTLSPDGSQVVTVLKVVERPESWKRLYPASSIVQNTRYTSQFVAIDLRDRTFRPLTGAPVSDWWFQEGEPTWLDNRRVLLPNTFIEAKGDVPSRPCAMAVADTARYTAECQQFGHFDPGTSAPQNKFGSMEVKTKESINEPPLLVATMGDTTRTIWDPNPQLREVALGDASVYTWTDQEGREWRGGLYKPADYKPGVRYPLVIQTHGFVETQFTATGLGPAGAGYAARPLAAGGIVVLQVEEGQHCPFGFLGFGACGIEAYSSAVAHLAAQGVIDSNKVGIMGFSATVSSVMQVLTASSMHVISAILNDGNTAGLVDYFLDEPTDAAREDIIGWVGAPPYGAGLQTWLKNDPDFNIDKVHAPVLIAVPADPRRLLAWEWQTYRGLSDLHKPVDLIMLNTDQHGASNPAVAMAWDGSAVDWFRFWLQGYEDPDPAKGDQYRRWGELKKLRAENEKTASESARGSH